MKKFLFCCAVFSTFFLFTACDFGSDKKEAVVANDELKKDNKPGTDEEELVSDESKKDESKDTDSKDKKESNPSQNGMATLYIPNSNSDGFDLEQVKVDKCPDDIVNLLVEKDALPKGTRILDFALNKTKRTASINLSKEYGEKIFTLGTSGEDMLIGSLVNTLVKYYDIDNITLKVEGESLESGNNDYSAPLSFYGNDKLGNK